MKTEVEKIAAALDEALTAGEAAGVLKPLRARLRRLPVAGPGTNYVKYLWLVLYEHAFASDPTLLYDKRTLKEAYKDSDEYGVQARALVRRMQEAHELFAQGTVSGFVDGTFHEYYKPTSKQHEE